MNLRSEKHTVIHMTFEKGDEITMENSERTDMKKILEKQKRFFARGVTKDISFRKKALKHLKRAIRCYEEDLEHALNLDLGKHKAEAYMTEIGFVLAGISQAVRNLEKWAEEENVLTPVYMQPGRSRIRKEPYGSVLVIGPYNYPFQLLMEPLVGAIAAGNCAVVRTSKQTPHTSEAIRRMLVHAFRPEYIYCAAGDEVDSQELLSQRFDYIFFTGSPRVGRLVMKAAADNLIPVTLELGGKSPVTVDKTADIPTAARRIMWGKLLNAGQTCVAPDYILADASVIDRLIGSLKDASEELYGKNIVRNPDYGRIVNQKHYTRLAGILEADREWIVYGGEKSEKLRFIGPAILNLGPVSGEAQERAASMQEELFGPVLPVLAYDRLQEALDFINERERPLALYLFTEDRDTRDRVLEHTCSGGVCVNDTVEHLVNHRLPFGGIGNSGMGRYHGRYGFDTFTHLRAVYEKPPGRGMTPGYPPYSETKLKLIRKFLR